MGNKESQKKKGKQPTVKDPEKAAPSSGSKENTKAQKKGEAGKSKEPRRVSSEHKGAQKVKPASSEQPSWEKEKTPEGTAPGATDRSPGTGKARGKDWESFLARQKEKLLELRDHILNQMQGVAQDTLRVSSEGSGASPFGLHQADAGSEAYDKDFALTLLSQEQDALYEIEEALKRIETGTYGICQMCGNPIPRARLEAVPYARFCVGCQREQEREYRARRRWESVPQFMESAEGWMEEEGEEALEEEERRREKE
ncbi:TraR/DksA family transcriptional regulator [Candidatus Methylacidithermus pantelleriae]|uniref:DksA C4-type domain-containing protein n=1 Tax=Candidatus Methylacidithermus pantelleriae TaxID=2744239 RepID=A0A8J2FUB9_9BACT|nr:TraR/DksA C4-type zinc finger protein [Candidatus Methylacidithermus pantelleriae]CAF0703693.1 DksA C4-type domain-containing protein [Candidatus Methylacidithermus pantelleriae]